jgi:hypothetical protein
MADVYGSNYQKEFVNIPSEQGAIGEMGGKVKAAFDSFSGASGGDDVYFGKIPAGARILSLNEIGGGTAPSFNVAVGDKISSEQDLICTLDADAAASGSCWVEYLLD